MHNNYIKDHKEFVIELKEMQIRYDREDEDNSDFYEDENGMVIINYEEESNTRTDSFNHSNSNIEMSSIRNHSKSF